MTISHNKNLSALIKEKAYELGFDLCGISSSGILKDHEFILKNWCSAGMNADMNYLCQNTEKRFNPQLLFPGAKSVIVTGLNYFTTRKQAGENIPVISKYAYGVNYHEVIQERLNKILAYIKEAEPQSDGKSFVDSAPILEKAWAREAGLGWPGRHSVIINKEIGSFFFIGIILLNIDLGYDKPFSEDHCGTCRLCIDLCPTGAINENRTIDARKCIAYQTIENKSDVPEEIIPKMERRVFGCDKCQDVCPWNKTAKPHKIPEFELSEELEHMTAEDWLNLTKEQYLRLFKKSAVGRKKYDNFMKNVTNVTKSNG